MTDLFAGVYFTVVLDKDNSNDGIYCWSETWRVILHSKSFGTKKSSRNRKQKILLEPRNQAEIGSRCGKHHRYIDLAAS
jgi:hypothetical protein